MNIFRELNEMFGDMFDDGMYYLAHCPECKRMYDVTWDESAPRCEDFDVPLKDISRVRKYVYDICVDRRSVVPKVLRYGCPSMELRATDYQCLSGKEET